MAPFFILSSKKMRIGNFLLVPFAGALLYTLMALLRAAACRRDAELADEAPVFARRADSLDLPGEDLVGDMYLETIETLEAAGLKQYEISNFARSGFESRHNLKYWHCEEYLGFGPSAHSYFRGKRFYRAPDWDAFVSGAPVVADGTGGSFEERLMLALRLTEGYRGDIPDELRQKASEPYLQPFVEVGDDFLRLTKEGFLVSNTVIAELL